MKKFYCRAAISSIVVVAALMSGDATSGREPETAPRLRGCGTIAHAVIHTRPERISVSEAIETCTEVKHSLFTELDVAMLARVAYCESRGIESQTEIACVMWTILNRVDAGYASTISEVVMAPRQFAYDENAPTTSDYGYDLLQLAEDVLGRWEEEKTTGITDGRVLPPDFFWYHGDGKHNWFRSEFRAKTYWEYEFESPYYN